MGTKTTGKEAEAVTSSEVVSASVPRDTAGAIREEAAAEDRTMSYIIARILTAHYAKRTAKARKLNAAA